MNRFSFNTGSKCLASKSCPLNHIVLLNQLIYVVCDRCFSCISLLVSFEEHRRITKDLLFVSNGKLKRYQPYRKNEVENKVAEKT